MNNFDGSLMKKLAEEELQMMLSVGCFGLESHSASQAADANQSQISRRKDTFRLYMIYLPNTCGKRDIVITPAEMGGNQYNQIHFNTVINSIHLRGGKITAE